MSTDIKTLYSQVMVSLTRKALHNPTLSHHSPQLKTVICCDLWNLRFFTCKISVLSPLSGHSISSCTQEDLASGDCEFVGSDLLFRFIWPLMVTNDISSNSVSHRSHRSDHHLLPSNSASYMQLQRSLRVTGTLSRMPIASCHSFPWKPDGGK